MALAKQYQGWWIYRRLLHYSWGYWRYLLIAIIGFALSAASQPLFAWIMKPLLDKAILQHDATVIDWLPIGILLIFLLRGVAMFVSSYYIALVGRLVTQRIRNEVFAHLIRLPVRFFEQHTGGNLLAHVLYYTDQVSGASTRGIATLVQDGLTIIGLLLLMAYQSWQLMLGILVIVPLIAVVVLYVTKRLRRISHHVQDSMGDLTQICNEVIRGYKVVRIFNGETYEEERFAIANQHNMHLQMKRLTTELLGTPVVQFLVAIALAAIVFIATRPGTLATLSPGTFMSFITSMIFMLTPIRNLTQLNVQLQTALAAGESIFKLLDTPTEPDMGTKALTRCVGEVEFRQVQFSYPSSNKVVLDNINLQVKAGQRVALIGRSGSGKTTLVNLLARFHLPDQGTIYLDGEPINNLHLLALRRQIAYVGQDVVLFNDTVRNNIAYGDLRLAKTEDIMAAAEVAHADEFIRQLPQGLETVIGDNGVMLSGGQRQRLSIARAVLADAPILILDEATSALDTESERYIQTALERLAHNRTTLVIAHRLSTIESADLIVVMHEGKIVEQGTHQALLAFEGYYARLHRLQFKDLV